MWRGESSSSAGARESAEAHAFRITILERLSVLATPDSANSILRTALTTCARRFVPESNPTLREFVHGPLRRATSVELGNDAADALMDDLAILVGTTQAEAVDLESSHVRLTRRPDVMNPTPLAPAAIDSSSTAVHARGYAAVLGTPVPTVPPPETMASMRVVFASGSHERVEAVANELGASAEITRVSDIFELVDVASDPSDGPVIVVVDRSSAVMNTSTLAAAQEELPRDAIVVLWGDANPATDTLPDVLTAPASWTTVGNEASVRELATILTRVGHERRSRVG